MKSAHDIFLFAAALGLLASSSVCQAQPPCASVFSKSPPAESLWRKGSTEATPKDEIFATSASREANIKSQKAWMENFILNFDGQYGHGDTPPMLFVAEEGAKASYISQSNGLHGTLTRIQVSGVGASAAIRGSLLLPVSGHTGNANAKKWALTDTYSIRMDVSNDKEGKSWNSYSGNSLKALVQDIKSLDLVTIQELEVPLQKDHAVRIYYYRSGSGGPGGYIEGRTIEFVWDGT